ncbi:MAG: prepilin peptidase [Deltaproteobacteria bacterium]|nr:prepilin peptidase [Deltaproteobacteria bacterium]MBW2052237.1 prepilin peptidase [Deltaproteobacteria bacterium]MBW2141689.1 prepilin peptidase [Deltaproteobacteria bacterium]MBW2322056.1 prepilin peptidase [Deltaproteobacteria bacterium]
MFTWVIYVFIFVFGACLGSFINVVIHRLPRELSLVRPHSMCPQCGAQIAWYDNLPLLSYLILQGRCRKCGASIAPRYFIVELTVGLLTLAVYVKFGLTLHAFFGLYLVLSLVAITYIDLDEMIIPDRITLPGITIGLLAAIIAPNWDLIGPWLGGRLISWGLTNFRLISLSGSVLGLFLGGATVWLIFKLYYLVRKEEGIGGGDFTLLSMIGAFLGWRSVFVSLFFGSVIGLVVVIGMAVWRRELDSRTRLPFGPFLSLAALVYLFFGEAILKWYLP